MSKALLIMENPTSIFFLLTIFIAISFNQVTADGPPNIILILADDFGWYDVSFHGGDQIPTPNIDALAYNGVILNSYYTLPLCTPSRSALMTGLYPIHTGMQNGAISPTQRKALPKVKILPELLKDLNYKTEIVGKWHLGYYRADFLPNVRGFDSFLGYYNGYNRYYDYIVEAPVPNAESLFGFDLRRNTTPAYDLVGQYATDMFTDEAVRNIQTHDNSQPLFLYVPHLAVHASNTENLLEAPQSVINRFRYIADTNRITYAAMVAKLDESVGRIVSALERAEMLHNSIIMFLADNGAPTIGPFTNTGSNYPLRGIKGTLWEGGIRGAGLIWSPLIKEAPRVSNDLIHLSDLLPTLYAVAGGELSDLPTLDGINQWENIAFNSPSKRNEILLNIDDVENASALRYDTPKHHWKIVVGALQDGQYDGCYGDDNGENGESNPPYSLDLITGSEAYQTLQRLAQKHSCAVTPPFLFPLLRDQATVKCNYPVFNRKRCNSAGNSNNICLYDLKADPCELNNLTSKKQKVVDKLLNKINEFKQTLVPTPDSPTEYDLANPAFFNGTWSPWRDLNNVPFVSL